VRHDESGDSEDEPPCVIGGECEGNYLTGLTKFGGELIPEVRCSVLERVISDFQRGPGWCTSKSDHRQRCVVTGLNREQVVEIMRLVCCENLICKRKEFILDTFVYS